MKSKEEKLREALNEYFGRDVGDVKGCFIDPASPTDYVPECPVDHTKQITILTKQHVPTFAEKRKELVDQLDKDLKEIDDDYSVVKSIASPDVTYIHYDARPYCELYPNGNIHYDARPYCELYPNGNIDFHGVYDSVKQMIKVMETISGFSWKLKRLKEQYKDETI